MDVRCYLASWIEEQCWDDITESPDQDARALGLLEQIISLLQRLAQESSNVVERMRLQHIARNMNGFRSQPIQLVKTVQSTLKKERILLGQVLPAFSPSPSPGHAPQAWGWGLGGPKEPGASREMKKIHQLQEELNWERANFESIQVSLPASLSNGLDPKSSEQVNKFQNRIQQLEFNGQEYAKKRVQLLQEAVDCLEHCQSRLVHRIKSWRREQHLSSIGAPFDDNLGPLQTWCEQLLGVNDKLRQEVILVGRDCLGAEPITELQERLRILLQTLVQSSLMVDKQPPQVIKTQSKFSTTVRYLLGEKVTPGKPVLLKAQIITEVQARNLGQLGSIPTENVGELINNTAILEHNSSTKSTCATFRNMSIKKIKRADRKGSESVTEEKFALLFSSEISITGCDTPYCIQMISLPIVVIVHGSQDNNALATIIWDCAFSEPFNKEVLPGRAFTFWQWFDGVMELTKKHLKCYWSDGLIFGFIGKQHLHLILQDRPDGTFLLRFSDSEIGGITIAYVSSSENRGRKIQNIQPFTKKTWRSKYYTDDPQPFNSGYIPVSIHTKVAAGETSSPPSSMDSQQEPSIPPQNRMPFPSGSLFPMPPQGNGVFSPRVTGVVSVPQPQFQPTYSDMDVPSVLYPDPLSIGPFSEMSQSNPSRTDDMELEDFLGSEIYEIQQ
ncbi:hypothetical protein AGOR_G00131090 [Albula goreensis]|uniref:Signal transducer and activator of transcription n=1 Tax=Albula goreensis TaxID=1534307 RepID=A0A8T3D837_9TELE|nr:hypothetical protein AGOR_G00131090 [Albula goreensis]